MSVSDTAYQQGYDRGYARGRVDGYEKALKFAADQIQIMVDGDFTIEEAVRFIRSLDVSLVKSGERG